MNPLQGSEGYFASCSLLHKRTLDDPGSSEGPSLLWHPGPSEDRAVEWHPETFASMVKTR